jgi:hypothetical protein
MIWVSICFGAGVGKYTTTHNTLQNIVATIILENGTHVQRKVFHLFLHHI